MPVCLRVSAAARNPCADRPSQQFVMDSSGHVKSVLDDGKCLTIEGKCGGWRRSRDGRRYYLALSTPRFLLRNSTMIPMVSFVDQGSPDLSSPMNIRSP